MKRLLLFTVTIFLVIVLRAQDKFEMTVSKDGTGDFTTIQAAIDASKSFPDGRITIFIRNGVYREKIVVPSCNTKMTLVGESREKTIITYDDYFNRIGRGRNSTFYTYTLKVEADDFVATNLTIENNAGKVGQAVALHIEGNRCVIRDCNILGNQDTLYINGENSNQYFKNCLIEGTTDFIFGSATALFEDCTLHCKGDSYITAASTSEGKSFGFVFKKCRVTAAEGVSIVYLGRPWRDYAKVVFIECDLPGAVVAQGWSNWSGTARDKTAYYAEYKNSGQGNRPDDRAAWSHQLTETEVKNYTNSAILHLQVQEGKEVEDWTKRQK
ncbi:MAG: pectinesterase family protein [Bacteroidales bacterium]